MLRFIQYHIFMDIKSIDHASKRKELKICNLNS